MEKLVAHRGLNINGAKDNTYASIKNALDNNSYVGFECDIRTTKDNVFILNHNPIIKDNIISLTNYQELKEKYNITTLKEVLEIKSNKIFLLEIKEANLKIEEFLKLIEKYKDKNIYIMSFYNSVIKKLQKEQKSYKLGILNYVLNSEENYDKYDFICLLESIASKKLVDFFEHKKIETFIYGIHHLEKSVSIYKNSYFITDEVKN